ncbi:MAG: type II secretion system protein [Phycisphaerales bacterium]|nr:type II secretion system protein [Phycisphaerales bacterium]MCB9862512.1 type II secretion system protein [Phycisphaerales bacterium]
MARRQAFTLIELLVVISIISVLLSILLPVLSGARRTAKAVSCQAKMKEIGTGVQFYATDNDDWIIGSPAGSGAYIVGSFASGAATQRWDWMGPMAKMMGYPLPEGNGTSETIKRFNEIRGMPLFLCSANDFLATWYAGPNAGTGPMVSYNTSRYMLFEHVASGGDGISTYGNFHEEQLPTGWSPRLTRMGDVSKKVFAADGARYSTTSIKPDYDLTAQAAWGGTFADVAPYSTFSRSWDRAGLSGGSFDARIYAFRHSTSVPPPKAPGNAFKANFIFMDGHSEKLGDLEAANPHMWLPAGSKLTQGSLYPDVRQRYGTGTIEIGS